ncbi:MAG: alpha/beta family hydrolase [Bdellovibrionota bacterium]
MRAQSIQLVLSEGKTSGLWSRPPNPKAAFIFAHGAGAGMEHPFMQDLSARLFRQGIATLRFNFPYMEAEKKRPDPPAVAKSTVEAAFLWVKEKEPKLPVFLGGKSFGGRMASQLAAEKPLVLDGLVYVGFPLHPPDKPDTKRATHLKAIEFPQLFLQGTRDKLAELKLIRKVLKPIRKATLLVVEGADHGFQVLKRSGRTSEDVMDELATSISEWMRTDV